MTWVTRCTRNNNICISSGRASIMTWVTRCTRNNNICISSGRASIMTWVTRCTRNNNICISSGRASIMTWVTRCTRNNNICISSGRASIMTWVTRCTRSPRTQHQMTTRRRWRFSCTSPSTWMNILSMVVIWLTSVRSRSAHQVSLWRNGSGPARPSSCISTTEHFRLVWT